MSIETPLYDEDFYRWTQHQAALLGAGKRQELDCTNLAEEIESLGKWDKRDLEQRLEGLLIQLLIWWAKPAEHRGTNLSYSCGIVQVWRPRAQRFFPMPTPMRAEIVLDDTRLYT